MVRHHGRSLRTQAGYWWQRLLMIGHRYHRDRPCCRPYAQNRLLGRRRCWWRCGVVQRPGRPAPEYGGAVIFLVEKRAAGPSAAFWGGFAPLGRVRSGNLLGRRPAPFGASVTHAAAAKTCCRGGWRLPFFGELPADPGRYFSCALKVTETAGVHGKPWLRAAKIERKPGRWKHWRPASAKFPGRAGGQRMAGKMVFGYFFSGVRSELCDQTRSACPRPKALKRH